MRSDIKAIMLFLSFGAVVFWAVFGGALVLVGLLLMTVGGQAPRWPLISSVLIALAILGASALYNRLHH